MYTNPLNYLIFMKDFIKHSYALNEATTFFEGIRKEEVLLLYKELDYVYDLLESLDIVSIYSGVKLLKDFTVEIGMGREIYICVGNERKELRTDFVAQEIFKMFTLK